MNALNFFSHKNYDVKVSVVTEHYGPSSSYSFGVVWSRERCCVIDPGLGLFGDIRKYVEANITGYEKAIYTASTCGEPQAVGACGLFDEAFVNGPDLETAKANMQSGARLAALRRLTADPALLALAESGRCAVDNSALDVMDFHDPKVLRSPESFDHFHLGGVHLEGVSVPGYTPGSVIFTVHGDDTINCAFCGRTISAGTNYLQNLDRAGFQLYHDSLTAAVENMKRGCEFPQKPDMSLYIFTADSPLPARLDLPENLIRASGEILAGDTAADMPASYEGRDGCRLHITGNAVILYDPALLS